ADALRRGARGPRSAPRRSALPGEEPRPLDRRALLGVEVAEQALELSQAPLVEGREVDLVAAPGRPRDVPLDGAVEPPPLRVVGVHQALRTRVAAASSPSPVRYWSSAWRKRSMRLLRPRRRHTSVSASTVSAGMRSGRTLCSTGGSPGWLRPTGPTGTLPCCALRIFRIR